MEPLPNHPTTFLRWLGSLVSGVVAGFTIAEFALLCFSLFCRA